MPRRARLYVGRPASVRPVEDDVAALGPELAADAVEERRLAGAVGADQPDALARAHVELMCVHGVDPPEGLATPREGRERCGVSHWRPGRQGAAGQLAWRLRG